MKKGSLNFLNRKSPSLFDTSVQIKDIDNLNLVLDSNTIPETGTAKVRARPTVKHVSMYGDSMLGFAVPTPKVPVLPPVSEPQSRHTGSTERLFNGGVIAVSDSEEGEILIPPPPSVAPPPPPQFIPPLPQYVPPPRELFGELDPSVDLAGLQPPSMPAPKPPSLTGSVASQELHLASLKPPPMAPPKPPSNTAQNILPLPLGEKPQFSLPKTQKIPPPKPVRLYTTSSLESLSAGSAPAVTTPSATPASSFNPQTTAKLYNVPKTTVLHSQADPEIKTQHILLLEDSSGNPVGVHVNGKNPTSVKNLSPAPAKPVRRNSSGLQLEQDLQVQKEDLQETIPNQLPIQPTKPNMSNNSEPSKGRMLQEIPNRIPSPIKGSPKTEGSLVVPSSQQMKDQQFSSVGTHTYSPLLNRKLQVLRGHESSGVKEAAASPLALLKAAKERDKQRAVLSRQSSNQSSSSSESTNFSTQPGESRPNSFAVSSKSVSSRPASSTSENLSEDPKWAAPTDPETKSQSTQFSPSKPKTIMLPNPPSSSSLLGRSPVKQGEPTLSTSLPGQDKDHEDVVGIAFIPPPPEFANSDQEDEDEGPPNTPPPEPPAKSVPPVKCSTFANGPATFSKLASSRNPVPLNASPSTESKIKTPVQVKPKTPPAEAPGQPKTHLPPPPATQPPPPPSVQASVSPPAQLKTLPPAPPKIQPPAPPKTQPPAPPKTQPPAPPKTSPPAQTKTQPPALPPSQAPSVSASQATLLSILQKKMLEMDPKFIPTREADSSGEDWSSPLSDDYGATSSPLNLASKPKSFPIQGRGMDMKELETKVAKKMQTTVAKAPASSQSKQQYGMTFTVRPGTQQPITPLPKAE